MKMVNEAGLRGFLVVTQFMCTLKCSSSEESGTEAVRLSSTIAAAYLNS